MKADVSNPLPKSVTIRLGRRKMCLTWRVRAAAPELLRCLLRRSLYHLLGSAPAGLAAMCCEIGRASCRERV